MVQHVDAADPNIHEPKGVYAATAGQVYVANGSHSGTWMEPLLANVDFTRSTVVALTDNLVQASDGIIGDISVLSTFNGTGLTQVSDLLISDIPFNATWSPAQAAQVDKNFKEFFVMYGEQAAINASLKKDVKELTEKLEEVRAALHTAGVLL